MTSQIPESIDNENSYQKTLSILSQQSRPSKILCLLMNMLETYRQNKKMGWSRSWNKYGLTTFQSFKLDPQSDAKICEKTLSSIQLVELIPEDAHNFVRELFIHPERLMGFVFFSEYVEDKQLYETATLSFGRKVSGNPRFRDRFDIVFDAPVLNVNAQPLARVRMYIDPYQQGVKVPLYETKLTDNIPHEFNQLFEALCDYSWLWQPDKDKHWDHWTSRYINYFGPRSIKLNSSHFYQCSGQRFTTT